MSTKSLALAALCMAVFLGGCTVGPLVWTDPVTEELKIDAKGVNSLQLETHNGAIDCKGRPNDEPTALVKVIKKGGGLTAAEAKEALDAIEVSVDQTAGGVKRVAWKWKIERKPSWGAEVAYSVQAPATLAIDAQTHNGRIGVQTFSAKVDATTHNGAIEVGDVRGEVALVSTNGKIKVQASGSRLRAETHNGEIEAAYDGGEVSLLTHNGGVQADLSKCKSLGGEITSHNGRITLTVGPGLSADLDCSTANGSVSCDAPYQVQHAGRGHLTGKIGQGGSKLAVITHNGDIRIK